MGTCFESIEMDPDAIESFARLMDECMEGASGTSIENPRNSLPPASEAAGGILSNEAVVCPDEDMVVEANIKVEAEDDVELDSHRRARLENNVAKAVAGFNSIELQKMWLVRDEWTGLLMPVQEHFNCSYSQKSDHHADFEGGIEGLKNLAEIYAAMDGVTEGLSGEQMLGKIIDDSDAYADVTALAETEITDRPELRFELNAADITFQLNPLKISTLKTVLKNIATYCPPEKNYSAWVTELLTKTYCKEANCWYPKVFPLAQVPSGPAMWPKSVVSACTAVNWNFINGKVFFDALESAYEALYPTPDKAKSFAAIECLPCVLYKRAAHFVSEQTLPCLAAEGLLVDKIKVFHTKVGHKNNSELDSQTTHLQGDYVIASAPLAGYAVEKRPKSRSGEDPWAVLKL